MRLLRGANYTAHVLGQWTAWKKGGIMCAHTPRAAASSILALDSLHPTFQQPTFDGGMMDEAQLRKAENKHGGEACRKPPTRLMWVFARENAALHDQESAT